MLWLLYDWANIFPLSTLQNTGCAPHSVLTLWRVEKSVPLLWIEPWPNEDQVHLFCSGNFFLTTWLLPNGQHHVLCSDPLCLIRHADFCITFKQPQHLAWLNPKWYKVTQPEVSLVTYYGSNMTLWNVCHTDSISTVETAIPLLKPHDLLNNGNDNSNNNNNNEPIIEESIYYC